MTPRPWAIALACALLTATPAGLLSARDTIALQQDVPADLKPLLAPRASEMRLVVLRYNADRALLNGNYAGGAGRGGGRRGGGAPGAAPVDVPVSPARIARLKRFDLDWQTALAKVDTSKLTAVAKSDLDGLKSAIQTNLAALDADAILLSHATPAVPFMPTLVKLIEDRIRIEPMNAQKSALTLTEVTSQMAQLQKQLDAGIAGMGGDMLRLNKDEATLGAQATLNLKSGLAEWYGFYNGYDPLFTWWIDQPYKKFDKALQDYATFLQEKVATANLSVTEPALQPIPAGPAPKVGSVPDLNDIIALPQDEMRDIVARFMAGTGGGGRGGRGGGDATADPKFYADWLAALKTLDFDSMTRNAQVDYLTIKHRAELYLSRVGKVIPPGPPRKADNLDLRGTPRGREGLINDLQDAMIVYTPEQLIALANKEFAWCEAEMKRASREMGYGDDWKKAVEHTKESYVPPGEQPRMIMGLLNEAIDYLRANDLITVPGVAAESLHMTMMSPEAQLTSPFFLGGDHILVSYPTDTMDYEARMESMRGNNPGFSHATAFHEMIPGHNLVGYMGQRYQGYRANLGGGGAFFGEGWPLYWELTMYDLGFDKTPEQKVGALFWHMHRCARIIFSLNFHMGLWSPRECVDFLVDKVGHEPANAEAEVRRSFESPQYANQPLYQAAYLLGGLQLRGIRKDLVDSKIMTNKQFHDEVMRQGNMPIALIRLAVSKMKLTRDMDISFKFAGDLPPQ
jgi:Bacterial protein of unknown function (DUF885)